MEVVVVGGGQAASRTVDCLRLAGFTGGITLVSEEAHLPYQRPPLCKTFLAGAAPIERFHLKHRPFYERQNIRTRLGTRVTALDPGAHRIELASGEEMACDRLVLCLGSQPRRLDVPGSDLAGIHYLRTATAFLRTCMRPRASSCASAPP
jgi:3-phenylpropionate/trans-cinnamate dioxygenase ferredoxin reductase subunit